MDSFFRSLPSPTYMGIFNAITNYFITSWYKSVDGWRKRDISFESFIDIYPGDDLVYLILRIKYKKEIIEDLPWIVLNIPAEAVDFQCYQGFDSYNDKLPKFYPEVKTVDSPLVISEPFKEMLDAVPQVVMQYLIKALEIPADISYTQQVVRVSDSLLQFGINIKENTDSDVSLFGLSFLAPIMSAGEFSMVADSSLLLPEGFDSRGSSSFLENPSI